MLYQPNHRSGIMGAIIRLTQKVDFFKMETNTFKNYLEENYSTKPDTKISDLIQKDKKILSKIKKDLANSHKLASAFNEGMLSDDAKIQQNKLLNELYVNIYEQELSVNDVLNSELGNK